MRRSDLEHLIRAVASLTDQNEMVIVGSQSILGAIPQAPPEFTASSEADVFTLADPKIGLELIDGSIGEFSPFHKQFGFYAQGVGPNTAILPTGWFDRAVKIQNENTRNHIGYCLEPHDLAASKLAAGRDKDWAFVRAMIKHKLIQTLVLQERINALPLPSERKDALILWVRSQQV